MLLWEPACRRTIVRQLRGQGPLPHKHWLVPACNTVAPQGVFTAFVGARPRSSLGQALRAKSFRQFVRRRPAPTKALAHTGVQHSCSRQALPIVCGSPPCGRHVALHRDVLIKRCVTTRCGRPHTKPALRRVLSVGWLTRATAGYPARRPVGPSPRCGDVRLRHPAFGVEPA